MRIVVAPDSYKGSVSATGVARAMHRGIRQVFPDAEVCLVPIADGGEGTVDALIGATGGQLRQARVRGPLGDSVTAPWGILGNGTTAVIEMAAASGLPLVPHPYAAVGEAIGWSEPAVIAQLEQWIGTRVVRRIGAVVRHRRIGYHDNAMCVWNVPDEIGRAHV